MIFAIVSYYNILKLMTLFKHNYCCTSPIMRYPGLYDSCSVVLATVGTSCPPIMSSCPPIIIVT